MPIEAIKDDRNEKRKDKGFNLVRLIFLTKKIPFLRIEYQKASQLNVKVYYRGLHL